MVKINKADPSKRAVSNDFFLPSFLQISSTTSSPWLWPLETTRPGSKQAGDKVRAVQVR